MRTSKKILFVSLLALFTNQFALAQETEEENEKAPRQEIRHPNIVKINSLALLFKNVSLVYERGLMPRLSAGIGFGYKFTGTEPKLFSVNNSLIGVEMEKISGFSITPEARYYLRACDPSLLEGFYAGMYLRYTGYKTGASFTYLPETNVLDIYDADVRLDEFGVGLQLGYQMLIKERFSLDFLFFGPRFSSYSMSYEFNQVPSSEFLDDLSDYINEVVDRLGFDYKVDVDQQGETKARSSFSFVNARFGFSLGYAF